MAERMGISSVWVKKLCRRYRNDGKKIPKLGKPGRRRVEDTDEESEEAYHGQKV